MATSGWTASSLAPNMELHDASLATRIPDAPLPAPAASVTGPVNAWAQIPLSAAQLRTDPSVAKDPSLASRSYMNPMTGLRDTAASASVYQQADAPAFLQQAISNLNAEQALKRSMQAELVNRIITGMQGGGNDSYLWTEALRAAAVNPGAHVAFQSAVSDPAVGRGYETASKAAAGKLTEQTKSLSMANSALSALPDLQAQRARLGSVVMGGYQGSDQQRLDNKIQQAYMNSGPSSSTQLLGRSANYSGWMPSLPTF